MEYLELCCTFGSAWFVYIPTYMLASSLIEGGMNWWQAILDFSWQHHHRPDSNDDSERTCRAKYGIPFPVFLPVPTLALQVQNIRLILRAIVAWLVRNPNMDRRIPVLIS